jgi:hypothetical protein
LRDDLSPFIPGIQRIIPPDGETMPLQKRNDKRGAGMIRMGIGKENEGRRLINRLRRGRVKFWLVIGMFQPLRQQRTAIALHFGKLCLCQTKASGQIGGVHRAVDL